MKKKLNTKKWIKLAEMAAVFTALLLLPQPVQYHTAYDIVTSGGVFTEAVTFESEDGDLIISIPEDTVGKTEDGDPLPSISITKKLSFPNAPEDGAFVGMPYDLEPDGATFDPPITITFTYDPTKLPDGVEPKSLGLAYYDEETKSWVMLDPTSIKIDPETNTITAEIDHFTLFGVMASTKPAEFTVSGLVFPSTPVGIAEQAAISAMVANNGDVSGTTTVTLKINGTAVASKSVKVAGLESKKVSFSVVQGKAGDYKVEIDGLSGTYTVEAAFVGPVLIASPVPSVTAPAAPPSAPTAPSVPAAPAPVPAPTPWTAIIISLVVAAIVGGVLVWNYGFRSEY
ncbi:MAG: hypothetical protein AMJ70_06555 [Dehalococcoidia bacterium SG8_51_3]|nr:MAG: hypothetical protein AMJ70_06555 [Dehalococcoidia bacterium SG8_51_3]